MNTVPFNLILQLKGSFLFVARTQML